MNRRKKGALIIVDVQNDFCPGGALAVPEGDEVIPIINYLMLLFQKKKKVFTKDWHSKDNCSFREQGGPHPKHCVKDTWGAEFHPSLKIPSNNFTLIFKGMSREDEGYSGFENTPLKGFLKENKVTTVYVCGLATDYCVKATALDAKKYGFETMVVIDACRGVEIEEGSVAKSVREMEKTGIKIISSKDVPCTLG